MLIFLVHCVVILQFEDFLLSLVIEIVEFVLEPDGLADEGVELHLQLLNLGLFDVSFNILQLLLEFFYLRFFILELPLEVHDEVRLGDAACGELSGAGVVLVLEELVDFAHFNLGGLELGLEHAIFDIEFIVFLLKAQVV